jgi:hypothetical protein
MVSYILFPDPEQSVNQCLSFTVRYSGPFFSRWITPAFSMRQLMIIDGSIPRAGRLLEEKRGGSHTPISSIPPVFQRVVDFFPLRHVGSTAL